MAKRDRIREELQAIAKATRGGILHAARVVDWARDHKKSALHSRFVWDDRKAAREFRLYQARHLIQLYVVDASGDAEFVNLTIDRAGGGGYRPVVDVLSNKQLSIVMLSDAVAELRRVQQRYARVRELTSVWAELVPIEKRLKRKRPKK